MAAPYRACIRSAHDLMAAPFLEAARYRACASRRACIHSALERCESPLTIGFHVNREPELGERPALFIAARPDAHVEEDIERFLVRQPAVLVNVIDHIRVCALGILRIDLEMFDQG